MHKISDTVERKFIDSVDIDEYEIWTDSGWQDISAIHKTVEYERWIIKTERGLYLECADKHIIFNDKMEEIFIENCIPHNTKITTEYGSDLVIECYKTDIIEPMFDITVDSEDHRFYSNGILSHNTTTVAALLLWYILFQDSFSIAILANKERQSREILSRIQLAFEHLPKWLQQGVIQWNKGNIELENGSKILSSSTSSSAIRGGSFNLIYLDEFAFVPNNLQEEFFASVYPTISSGQSSKVLITSTPNGMNMFYKIWTDSEEGRNRYQRVSVHWSDVPGRDDVWKDETISNTSERQFDQEFNCFSSETLVYINNQEQTIGDLYDELIKESIN